MVDFALTVEDREERNKVAKSIIAVMGNMYPHLRDVSDFRHKLWDHLALMSDFNLDIDSPFETPTKEKLSEKPEKVPYKNERIKYRHYGKTIESLIAKAIEMEDQKEKEALILMIANHMKKSYINWNKDSVPDDKIFQDIAELSNGELIVPEELKLREARDKDFAQKNKPRKKNTGGHRNDHRKHNKNR
jgi:hypothetical protein